MSTDDQIVYVCKATQLHGCRSFIDPCRFDMVPIVLKLYHQTVTYSGNQYHEHEGASDNCYGKSNLVSVRRFEVPVSDFQSLSKRDAFTRIATAYLQSLGVPEDKHAAFIEQISLVILQAVPGIPISVRIVHVTLHHHVPKAITLYVDQFEKLRVDNLEVANTPCAICIEDLDQFPGGINEKEQTIIVRLPCLHLYHLDCIGPWLERHQLCPLCRYSLPPLVQTTKVKSLATYSARLLCPVLLIVASGCCLFISAKLLCGVLKRCVTVTTTVEFSGVGFTVVCTGA